MRRHLFTSFDEKGKPISGLDSEFPPHVKVFHAGTAESDGQVVTSGGRVLCVCALGESVAEAQRNAYQGVSAIHWTDCYFRRDIGHRAVSREQD